MSRLIVLALLSLLVGVVDIAGAQTPRPSSRPIEFIPNHSVLQPGWSSPALPPHSFTGPGFPGHSPAGGVTPLPAIPVQPLPPPPVNRVLGVTFSMTVWGPQITSILPNSHAQFSGLCVGDILLTANGHRLLSRNDFINHVSYSRSDVVIFQVWDARWGRVKFVRVNFDFGNDLEVRSAPASFRR